MSRDFKPGGERCEIDGIQAKPATDILYRLFQDKPSRLLAIIRPQIQLDRAVCRHQITGADGQRPDIMMPRVPTAEQIKTGFGNCGIALGWIV